MLPDIADSEWQNVAKRNAGGREEPIENVTTLFFNSWGWYMTHWHILPFCTSSIINLFDEAQGFGSRSCFHLQAMGPPSGALLAWRQKQGRLTERRASLQNYTMDKVHKEDCVANYLFFQISLSHNRYDRYYRICLFNVLITFLIQYWTFKNCFGVRSHLPNNSRIPFIFNLKTNLWFTSSTVWKTAMFVCVCMYTHTYIFISDIQI